MNEEKPDDVVISGISGVFPGSKDMIELETNLRNKVNLVQSKYTLYFIHDCMELRIERIHFFIFIF